MPLECTLIHYTSCSHESDVYEVTSCTEFVLVSPEHLSAVVFCQYSVYVLFVCLLFAINSYSKQPDWEAWDIPTTAPGTQSSSDTTCHQHGGGTCYLEQNGWHDRSVTWLCRQFDSPIIEILSVWDFFLWCCIFRCFDTSIINALWSLFFYGMCETLLYEAPFFHQHQDMTFCSLYG